jgi:hypothetical protein
VLGRRNVGAATRGDVGQETQGPRLIAAFTAPTSEHHRAIGTGTGIIELVREQIRLAQLLDAERVVIPNSGGFIVGQRLLQAGEASVMRPDQAMVWSSRFRPRGHKCSDPAMP